MLRNGPSPAWIRECRKVTAVASGQIDSAQNLEVSTQESKPGVVDEAGSMGESLTGESLNETVPSVWKGIVYEVTLDVNISKRQIGKYFHQTLVESAVCLTVNKDLILKHQFFLNTIVHSCW